MNPRSNDANTGCLPEFLLEEHAMGRLGEEGAHTVETHLNTCPGCKSKVDHLRKEAVLVSELMRSSKPEPTGECIDDETLALYLDEGLDADEREEAEGHLSTCRSCQGRLIQLNRAIRSLVHEDDTDAAIEFATEGRAATLTSVTAAENSKALPARKARPEGLGWPLALCLASFLVAGLSVTFARDHVLHLQFFALACTGYLGCRWVLLAPDSGVKYPLRAHSTFSLTNLPGLGALALYGAAWFQGAWTTWLLTASFISYLGWLFVLIRNRVAESSSESMDLGEEAESKRARAANEDHSGRR